MFDPQIYQEITRLIAGGQSIAVVTVIDCKGNTPGKQGFKMLVDAEGKTRGTVGGGYLEALATKEALASLKQGISCVRNFRLDTEEAGGIGMICGGEITVYIEVVSPAQTLLLVGAGHVSQPVAAMAKMLGFQVLVTDDRQEFCNAERFPAADRCLVADPADVFDHISINPSTYIVIVTRGHLRDQEALEKALATEAAYIGMIGSQKKVKTVFEQLRAKGVSEEELAKVHAPIGLAIGAETPAEIAVSILAEIIAVRNAKKDG
jgi:xanthine dehydrogenase accessory factor